MPANNPPTYLMDLVKPNTQDWQENVPILWTNSRIYSVLQQVGVAPDRLLVYKSIDKGITWSKPDAANANVLQGSFGWYWDGTNIVTLAFVTNNSGSQSLKLQDFDLDAETYSANYGNVAGVPTGVFAAPMQCFRMSDGSLMVFFQTVPAPVSSDANFAVFKGGAWTIPQTEFATNIPPGPLRFAQIETVIPDPANNLCHVYYSDTVTFYYRQIKSDGTLQTITTFPAPMHIHVGNLNEGRGFNNGFLDGTTLVTPAITRDPITGHLGMSMVFGAHADTLTPTFTQIQLETATGLTVGNEPGQAIAYNFKGQYSVLYFTGDAAGTLYNLVKLAQAPNWIPGQIYDATQDPNAGLNPHNNQWINTISGGPDGLGNFVFQIATWKLFPGELDVNTATLSTLVAVTKNDAGGAGTNTTGAGGAFTQNQHIMVLHIILPDPKVCKNSKQLNRRQFQTKFTLC